MTRDAGISRRRLLQAGAAAAAAGLPSVSMGSGKAARARRDARPRNIIFMVADGMSLGVPTLAEPFAQLVRGRGTRWRELMSRPAGEASHGYFDMASLNSLVTDSAAAASSWGSGSRVFNGAINALPDGTKLTPIAAVARDAGRRVGLVTTTTVTHATPAGFAAVQPARGEEFEIAEQYLDRVDVILGGGRPFFAAGSRPDKRDLLGAFRAKGYEAWNARAQLTADASPKRMIGLFGDSHLSYTIDNDATVPTLAEMTAAALRSLADAPNGFLLQVEGGRVDHAAHANDAAGILWEQLAFDDAVVLAVDFAEKRGDTLVVITSDHGNSNPGLNGVGAAYNDSTKTFETVAKAKASATAALEAMRQNPGGAGDVLRERLGVEPSAAEAAALERVIKAGVYADELYAAHANQVGVLGQIMSNHHGIGWTSLSHTADFTIVTAIGPGRERFAGLTRNTHAFGKLCELMGVKFKNPRMSAAEAAKFAHAAPRVEKADWA